MSHQVANRRNTGIKVRQQVNAYIAGGLVQNLKAFLRGFYDKSQPLATIIELLYILHSLMTFTSSHPDNLP